MLYTAGCPASAPLDCDTGANEVPVASATPAARRTFHAPLTGRTGRGTRTTNDRAFMSTAVCRLASVLPAPSTRRVPFAETTRARSTPGELTPAAAGPADVPVRVSLSVFSAHSASGTLRSTRVFQSIRQ